jgi:Putative beta-barrel porin 2
VICAAHRAAAAMAPPPFLPEDGDTYDVYVADQESYDSNLYRLPPNYTVATVLVPNATKQDYFNTASLGADGQLFLGRQIFNLDVRADENRFEHNTNLNNTAYNGDFLWNWRVGGYFSGQAVADYSHALAGFDETRYYGRDLVDVQRYSGSARYQVGPRWALYGSVTDSDITHSAQPAQYEDFRTTGGSGGIEYATDVNDTFALQYTYSDARYPSEALDEVNGQFFSPDFHDQLTRFLVKYAVSDKTKIDAYVGYIKRQYQNTAFGSFKGFEGRITMTWQATDKTQVVVAGWHELHAYLITQADYFVSEGGSIGPIWSPTDKLHLSMLLAYENQDFIPQAGYVLTTGPLQGKLTTATGRIEYTPRSQWILKLAFNYQKRSSNQEFYEYTDDLATLGVLYKTH